MNKSKPSNLEILSFMFSVNETKIIRKSKAQKLLQEMRKPSRQNYSVALGSALAITADFIRRGVKSNRG